MLLPVGVSGSLATTGLSLSPSVGITGLAILVWKLTCQCGEYIYRSRDCVPLVDGKNGGRMYEMTRGQKCVVCVKRWQDTGDRGERENNIYFMVEKNIYINHSRGWHRLV